MSYLNNYKPPVKPPVVPQLDDPIDLNFCLPIPEKLESERVKLVPFIPSQHGSQLLEAVSDHPELYGWLPYGPFHTSRPEQMHKWHEFRIRGDPATLLFAVIDKTQPAPASHPDQGGPLAGVMGFLLTQPENLCTEVGHVLVFPKWHKTFLTTNAVGLLIIQAFEGWHLRRVQWQAVDRNAPSIRTAQRMGLKFEGIIRWQRCLYPEMNPTLGLLPEGRQDDPLPNVRSRHSALLAICWDDYDREVLDKLIARTA